jgi:hypothetical protein
MVCSGKMLTVDSRTLLSGRLVQVTVSSLHAWMKEKKHRIGDHALMRKDISLMLIRINAHVLPRHLQQLTRGTGTDFQPGAVPGQTFPLYMTRFRSVFAVRSSLYGHPGGQAQIMLSSKTDTHMHIQSEAIKFLLKKTLWWLGGAWVVPVYRRGRVCAAATAQRHICVTGLHIPLCWVVDGWCVSGSLLMAIGSGFECPCSPAWVCGGFGVASYCGSFLLLLYCAHMHAC